LLLVGAGVALFIVLAFVASVIDDGEPASSGAAPTPTPVASDSRLVFTYYFYWYDSVTGGHLQEEAGIRDHLPEEPAPNWRTVEWHQRQLQDMTDAGIDAALPVYWGSNEDWSQGGLPVLAQAWDQLTAAGERPPGIGMFFDTTIINGRSLTTEVGKTFFYDQIAEFFQRIPPRQWIRVDGRPVVWLFTSDWTAAMDQSTFDFTYASFEADFGVRPYIVREVSWDFPILRWEGGVQTGTRVRDEEHPIVTDNSYIWAAAQNGYVDRGGVATVGPGYDDSLVPGRSGTIRPRDGGQWYRDNFSAAIASGKPLIALETWNEIHEGSSIAETLEFGRLYIDLTRELVDRFHGR
jgi:hypothetical protein